MTRKTISIDTDAYDILLEEKQDAPRQSFSDAIRHLRANRRARTFADLLEYDSTIFNTKKTRASAKKPLLAR